MAAMCESPQLLVRRICGRQGVPLNDSQLYLLTRFTELVLLWNSKINLLSRADSKNIWTSHVLHSISPLFTIDIPMGMTVLDLGSGGGFPGIPLAIVRSDLHITLLDSIKKKTTALENMIGELGLKNVSVMSGRAEDLIKKSGRFNVVFARGVSSLTDLIKWSKPLLTDRTFGDGIIRTGEAINPRACKIPCLIAMKGGDLDTEIHTAAAKTGERRITTRNLRFDGSLEAGLENKKFVIVEFDI